MEGLKTKGISAFVIYDDVYTIDSKRTMKIADLIIERNLDIVYRCTTRSPDFIRNPKLLDKLRESGCLEICIGLESGNEDVLKLNDKRMSLDDNRNAIRLIKQAGMKCLTYMITGLPGCSESTERDSYRFIQETEPDEIASYLLAPFPSTPLWINREKYGLTIYDDEIIANDWDVAQCRGDNNKLPCYISYDKIGGLNRHEIKDIWLKYRVKYDEFLKSKGYLSIQKSEDKLLDIVK